MNMKSHIHVWKRILHWLLGIFLAFLLLSGAFIAVLSFKPALGAKGADLLRNIFGDKMVAVLESNIYNAEDTIKQWAYNLGWTPKIIPVGIPVPLKVALATPSFTTTLEAVPAITPSLPNSTPVASDSWNPAALVPLKNINGETGWTAYLQAITGQTVADLTSFQPDPKRPYALAAVVAFNLDRTQLHFVLGTIEPYSPNSPPRSGAIPTADRAPGVLLAMFNGGFKAHQGEFGAMSDGIVALPPRDGLGTLAIDSQGGVHIGVWGKDISSSTNWVSWRQNGPLIIQQGVITPEVYTPLPGDWGDSVTAPTPIWRSGIGLSADSKTLYYACGPSLTIESLANSLLAVGSINAMQLDVNNYWVHFVGVSTDGKKLILTPLFPKQMNENIDRYLWNYERDYFYVTVKQ